MTVKSFWAGAAMGVAASAVVLSAAGQRPPVTGPFNSEQAAAGRGVSGELCVLSRCRFVRRALGAATGRPRVRRELEQADDGRSNRGDPNHAAHEPRRAWRRDACQYCRLHPAVEWRHARAQAPDGNGDRRDRRASDQPTECGRNSRFANGRARLTVPAPEHCAGRRRAPEGARKAIGRSTGGP